MALPLIVGVDGSQSGLQAVDWAVDEAARHGLPLRLVNASLWERYEGAALAERLGRTSPESAAEQIVGTATERALRQDPDVAVSSAILHEEATDALLRAAEHATALVTGQHGRGPVTELLLGSVSLALTARAPCPVIVVRGTEESREGTHGRVLLGVGSAATGASALRFALRAAEARGCTLEAVRAWQAPAHETVDHPLLIGEPEHHFEQEATLLLDEVLGTAAEDHPRIRVDHFAIEGPAHKVLLHRSADADLLVIGARHRHSHFGLQLGGVAHALLHHAACPVAVVPLDA
ncbi:universal stress protein [Streptomyces boluensis]|uniref:Universal stress protein n=1 Tax=Streptomyces boluensis TaxID=1775135 RepID=A0A964XP87_9ACTN|nr:universal stress protein [Streptomyces boluensis]NBE54547.1 universal stress protein [Streptomyces boluensis]